MSSAAGSEPQRYVSTGSLPGRERVADLVDRCYAGHRAASGGRVSTTYPALADADPDLFGICVANTDGIRHEAGDARVPFTVMSVSKPFVLALVFEALGVDAVRALVGVNATGLPFNSLQAVDRAADGRTNPMVNAGAIATSALAVGDSPAARWEFLRQGLSRFAGRRLELDEATLESARGTNFRNRALAMLLADVDALELDPLEAVDLYTRQCCLEVTAVDIATMGATLADGGVQPVTGERVVSAAVARATLAVMSIAGMYEDSGDWLLDVGFPGKSGISGGIVAVSPGKGAIGVYSPPLDERGNSVRGQLVARQLSRELGLDLLGSAPVGTGTPPPPA